MPLQFTEDPLPIINEGERHVAAVVACDTSGSTTGAPNKEMNQGLVDLGTALREDSLALGRAELSIISFNSAVNTEMSFRPATQYEAPKLSANGLTAMNEAINASLDALEARKEEYKNQGISYYRPWMFLLTDGAPTDTELEAQTKERLRNAIRNRKVVYMPMGIGNADIEKLREYYPEELEPEKKIVLKADAEHFKEAFCWLSQSLSVVSHSNPGVTDSVQLPPLPSSVGISIGII